jgi:Gpi18-like mannosyltransferase
VELTTAVTPVQITASREATGHWWHDRALVALLVLFGIVAPLVTHRIYASDEIQYFAYTHSLFFDRDFDFGNEYMHFYQSNPQKFGAIYTDLYLKKEGLTGLPINVAPIGTGLFWLPSYAVTHLFVTVANSLGANVPADGYSQPYITAICLTSYLLGCAGLLLCYLISRRLFGKRVSAVGVAVTWLATPLVFYTVVAPPWSHATSLFTVTLFLWYWLRTRRETGRGWREWLVLGLCAGLMMLVREQDALFLVVPGLEGAVRLVSQWRKSRFADRDALLRPIGGFILMGVTAAIVFVPQLIAYRAITGRFGPSSVVAGKFTWTSPNALNVLFSPEHGLVPWTPLVVVAMLGLVLLWRRDSSPRPWRSPSSCRCISPGPFSHGRAPVRSGSDGSSTAPPYSCWAWWRCCPGCWRGGCPGGRSVPWRRCSWPGTAASSYSTPSGPPTSGRASNGPPCCRGNSKCRGRPPGCSGPTSPTAQASTAK